MQSDIAEQTPASNSTQSSTLDSDSSREGNHGEGNPEAAARFNRAEQDFINSKRGQQKIQEVAKSSRAEDERGAYAEDRNTESGGKSPAVDGKRK